MREVQKKLGEDKLAVLMLDNEHEVGSKLKKARKKAEKFFAESKLDMPWDRVLVPGGSDTIHRVFNKSGYGLILVDPAGRVVSTNVRAKQLDLVLNKRTVDRLMETKFRKKKPEVNKSELTITPGPAQHGRDGQVVVPLKIKVPRGWHVYGSADLNGAATSLKVLSCEGLVLKAAQIPKGKGVLRDGILRHELSGEFTITLTLDSLQKQKGAAKKIRGSLKFMMCNEEMCLPPTRVSWQTTVAAKKSLSS